MSESDDKPFTKDSLSIDKLRFGLLEPEFTKGIVQVLTDGAKKYGDNNWKKCKDPSLYVDALHRHINAFQRGERNDPDDGTHHLLHAACNLMFLHWMDSNES